MFQKKRLSISSTYSYSGGGTLQFLDNAIMSLRPYRGGGGRTYHHNHNQNQQWRGSGRGFSSSSSSSDRPPPTTYYNNNHHNDHQPPSNSNYNYTSYNYNYNSPQQPPPQQQQQHHRVNNNQSYHNQPPPSYYNYSNPYLHHNHFPPPPLYNQSQQQQQHYFPPQNHPPPPFYNYNNQHPNLNHQHFQSKPLVVSDYRRKWEHANPPPPHPPPSHRFTVLSYNILADYLAINHRSQLYFHIPPYILDWRFRKTRILFELGLWSSDILCLQEVDRFHDLQQELKIRGYDGVWKMRTGEPVDGCAIFWRSTRFKLLHEEAIEYNKFGLRDNVAQICVLESLSEKTSAGSPTPDVGYVCSNKVVICNIHVLFNPKRGDIKLGQVRILLEKAYATSKHWDDAPVVLCGDYNSTPKSSLYNFISEQKLNVSELPRDKISGQLSTEIGPRRPFTYNLRTPSNDNATQSPRRVDKEGGSSISLVTETTQIDTKEEREGNSVICTSEVVEKISSDVIISDNSSDTLLEAIEHVSVGEDSTSFISELHGADGTDTVDGESFVKNQNPFYDPSGWTPMEIETATGNSECMTMEHHLKLRSTYTEVQDYSGARDSYGEPQVTSYHRRFQGTVDYIWRSEGLQTVRVLAPIPKHAMQWTPGFPTKKWGSDHIALVAELAFTGHVDEEKSQVY